MASMSRTEPPPPASERAIPPWLVEPPAYRSATYRLLPSTTAPSAVPRWSSALRDTGRWSRSAPP